ncbi:endonuclease/exonuclease/phosphatase family protein [Desulfosarcina sp.]|nr:endonuclease/exonuclease/phosphatase family protein [Desulfosarcina sp.]
MHTAKQVAHEGWSQLLRISIVLSVVFLQACASAELLTVPDVQLFGVADKEQVLPVAMADPGLTVMTLNMAHGRGDSFHQLLQTTDTTLGNLDAIAVMLNREQPDVIALQEADGPSFWSGNFNHVAYLAERSPYSWAVNGQQVAGIGLAYGTALLSSLELQQPQAITFDPSLAMIRKGFVVSTIDWPGQPDMQVDIVSVHLDFSSESTRRQQARELIAVMRDRGRPMIVMGDLNTDWHHEDSTVRLITAELDLNAHSPDAQGLETFPFSGKRLDWILLSKSLEFSSYHVVSEVLSDHRGVVAKVVLKEPPEYALSTY